MAVINVHNSPVKKKLFKLIVKVPVVGNTSTLTINLNSISISRVLHGSTTIYLYQEETIAVSRSEYMKDHYIIYLKCRER